MNSLEKAIWNWMDTYPNEFADLQVRGWLVSYSRHLKMFLLHGLHKVKILRLMTTFVRYNTCPYKWTDCFSDIFVDFIISKQANRCTCCFLVLISIQNSQPSYTLPQKRRNEELAKCCEMMFEHLESFAENNKRRAAVWPLQIMLLVLSPVSPDA